MKGYSLQLYVFVLRINDSTFTSNAREIPFLNLVQEIGEVFEIFNPKPKFHCKVFEDNVSCIKVAESPKFTHRTKHISIKHHHFRKHVSDGTITIHHINTKNQVADIFTKPLDEQLFIRLRETLMGWLGATTSNYEGV